ncbi:hypothetical protein M3212_13170 [Alkalihalobacillus oceani]|uniref:hypothetical protein n=1 Tax=Halalkalibacter oceani TaxID=1653776 RepID=UPI00204003DD|nr:hypothetical protein [Halalkalibacter oceani]MCM3761723.1 hypothetical protein [Halalkalibacter oceani]
MLMIFNEVLFWPFLAVIAVSSIVKGYFCEYTGSDQQKKNKYILGTTLLNMVTYLFAFFVVGWQAPLFLFISAMIGIAVTSAITKRWVAT